MMKPRLLVAVALPLLFVTPGLPVSRLSADQGTTIIAAHRTQESASLLGREPAERAIAKRAVQQEEARRVFRGHMWREAVEGRTIEQRPVNTGEVWHCGAGGRHSFDIPVT